VGVVSGQWSVAGGQLQVVSCRWSVAGGQLWDVETALGAHTLEHNGARTTNNAQTRSLLATAVFFP